MCALVEVSPPEKPAQDVSAEEFAQEMRVKITAGQVDLSGEEGVEFFDQVEFRYGDRSISAESATYDRVAQTIEVRGTVLYTDSDVTVYGEEAEVDTENEEIRFTGAGFDIPQRPARGSAETIRIRSDQTIALSTVIFTTCPADRTDWELMAAEVELDVEKGFGTARGVKVEFKGVPILYTPYMTFPIDDRRKSGLLTPKFSERDRTGLDISAPYYLNLAPNYDMTLEPRYMSERGVQLNTEFRYLLPRSDGRLSLEYLPDDSDTNDSRSYLTYNHETMLDQGWRVVVSLADVSDDAYFEDLGDSQAVASQTHLDRYLDIGYRAPTWSLLARFQGYQTIDTAIAADDRPYDRVPQILFNGQWSGDLFKFESSNELVQFDRDVGATGWRLDSTEEVSISLARPGMFLTPALALRQTNYWLDDATPGGRDTFSRTLPIASIDAGLIFERAPEQNRTWTQTIEPRVLYVHVPFEDQSDIPIFDTIEPDFNLVQLFRKYQYLGADRIADSEQLSLGITARLIDSRSGRETVTATLGQTRYFGTQRVSLPNSPPNNANVSDYIAEVSIYMSEAWKLDVDYQWNSETNTTARMETSLRFTPQEDRYAGFSYRYREGLLDQGSVSLVWPVGQSWRVIAHYSYSFLEEEPLDSFLGWEYEACCWRLRLIGRRYISRRTGESDSSISVQLQLRGFSDDGSSPEELLDRGILGYRSLGNTL
ncbi:MAG: LPS-assembly protein LptD [Gammaproteobacteria bacterium]|nr:MAG: LPS-assembly protein LptD [Gammaproteobacteria bacterium]